MEFCVLAFKICCLVCATIYVYVQERLRNGKNSFTLAWFQSSGRLRTRYLQGVEEFSNLINGFSDAYGSMKISMNQCQILSLECLRLEHTPPYFILKESFCAIRRALKLIQDCCSEDWILNAAKLGNCQRHFLEILLDLHRLRILVDLTSFRGESLDISEETKSEVGDAWKLDTAALRRKLMSGSIHDNWLAHQLEAEAKPYLIAPPGFGRCVTQFDIINTPLLNGSYDSRNPDKILVFRDRFRDKECVIKARIIKPKPEEQEDIILRKEATFMKKCRHPYSVALLGYWEFIRTESLGEYKSVPLLLMESMQCDLKSIIERNRKSIIERNKRRWWPWGGTEGFPALDAINLVLPVAKVMKYLHEIGVVHLDLKPQNILFTGVPEIQDHPEVVSVKLADFGEAQMAEDGVKGKVGTSGYMDPDMFAKKESVDLIKADVFSFGLVFGEVLTGSSPMEALGCKDLPNKFYEKFQKVKRVPLPKATPKFVKSIVESCLKLKPDERPSFDDICWKLQKAEIQLLKGWSWKCPNMLGLGACSL